MFPLGWVGWVGGCLTLAGCLGPLPTARNTSVSSQSGDTVVRGDAGALIRLSPSEFPTLYDDGSLQDLAESIQQSATYYRSLPSGHSFPFGPDVYTAEEMADSLDYFLYLMRGDVSTRTEALKRDFHVYASVGSDGNGTVVYSAYYEHSLKASLVKTKRFRYPLYGRPADLEEERLANGERRVFRKVGMGRSLYYTRAEIDGGQVLAGRGLEIAWADDPVEIFFLQVQGSGWLLLPDGSRLRVRYAGNNGHPYASVGGYMIEQGIVPRKEFSRKSMVAYLASHPDKRQGILNINSRYIFFQIDRGSLKEKTVGSLNLPLTPGRSVATDPQVFPPGALAWMSTSGRKNVQRFVLSQDEGGAIKGPARVDYFVGSGEEAETYAVGLWEKGRLFFLVKKRGGITDGGR
jgi:membrane-bound lytic murein transglycosylase A